MPRWLDTPPIARADRIAQRAAGRRIAAGARVATPARAAVAAVAVVTLLLGCGSPGAEHGRPRETAAPRPPARAATPEPPPATAADDTPDTRPEPAPATTDAPADPGAPAAAPSTPPAPTCTSRPFAKLLPLAEASGAVYLAHPEAPMLLVVGDSGTDGAYLELDPATGAVLAKGKLPLGRGASDDLEGLTAIGDTIYGITSSGWMRHWRRDPGRKGARRYQLVRGPYPVARPVAGDAGLVCDSAHDVNCGRNYEGLCLRDPPDPAAACAGFAVSKADGKLYCLTLEQDGGVRAHAESPVSVAAAETLTGCDFAPAGEGPDLVWVGSNAFGANRVFTVSGWQTPERARIALVGVLGVGFGEAMALGPGGAVYRFSDTASARSLADKYHCE